MSAFKKSLSATAARSSLFRLMEDIETSHTPVMITGKNTNSILIAETDWNTIQEMLHLAQIPGMIESIKEGMNTPIDECDSTLDWDDLDD